MSHISLYNRNSISSIKSISNNYKNNDYLHSNNVSISNSSNESNLNMDKFKMNFGIFKETNNKMCNKSHIQQAIMNNSFFSFTNYIIH